MLWAHLELGSMMTGNLQQVATLHVHFHLLFTEVLLGFLCSATSEQMLHGCDCTLETQQCRQAIQQHALYRQATIHILYRAVLATQVPTSDITCTADMTTQEMLRRLRTHMWHDSLSAVWPHGRATSVISRMHLPQSS